MYIKIGNKIFLFLVKNVVETNCGIDEEKYVKENIYVQQSTKKGGRMIRLNCTVWSLPK